MWNAIGMFLSTQVHAAKGLSLRSYAGPRGIGELTTHKTLYMKMTPGDTGSTRPMHVQVSKSWDLTGSVCKFQLLDQNLGNKFSTV